MAFGSFNTQEYSQEFQAKLKKYEEEEKKAMSGNDDDSYKVELYVYDMSKGLAKQMSPTLLGKQIEGIWHTGVVAYGREYFFGSGGIESCRPGGTILGEPNRVEDLGCSQVPYQLFLEYIFGLGESSYKPGAYDLLKHNCNNFSEEVSEFLCGRGIPKNILTLPDEVLNTELGETLAPLAKTLKLKNTRSVPYGGAENNINSYVPREIRRQIEDPELDELNSAIEEVRQNTQKLENRRNSLNEKLLRKEKKEQKKEKREKKKKKNRSSVDLGDDKDSRRRKKRGDSVQKESEAEEEPSEEVLTKRRFSEPIDVPVEGAAHPSRLPRSPTRHNNPHLPPPVPKKSPQNSPSHRLELPSSPSQTPSPVPSIEVTPTSPSMDEDGTDVPLPEVTPLPENTRQEPEDEELPPEVPREPPILFKEEVDVSSRGSFGDAWSSPLSRSLSSLSSCSSSEEGEYSSSSTSSFSSFYSSSSSSYSCQTHSPLSSSHHSLHDSSIAAFSNTAAGTSINIPVPVVTSGGKPLSNLADSNRNLPALKEDLNRKDEGECNRGSCDGNYYANISNSSFTHDSQKSDFGCVRSGLEVNANTINNYNQIKSCNNNNNDDNENTVSQNIDNFQDPLQSSALPSIHEQPRSCNIESFAEENTAFSIVNNSKSCSEQVTSSSIASSKPVIDISQKGSESRKPVTQPSKNIEASLECFDKIRNDVIISNLNCNTSNNSTTTILPTSVDNSKLVNTNKVISQFKNINLKSDYSSDIIPFNYNKRLSFHTGINASFKMPKESRPSDLPIKKPYTHCDNSLKPNYTTSVNALLDADAKNDQMPLNSLADSTRKETKKTVISSDVTTKTNFTASVNQISCDGIKNDPNQVDSSSKSRHQSRPSDLLIKAPYKPYDNSTVPKPTGNRIDTEMKSQQIQLNSRSFIKHENNNACLNTETSERFSNRKLIDSQQKSSSVSVKNEKETVIKISPTISNGNPTLYQPKSESFSDIPKEHIFPIDSAKSGKNEEHSEHYVSFRSSHRPKSQYLLDRLKLLDNPECTIEQKSFLNASGNQQTSNDKSNIILLPWHPSSTTSYAASYKIPSPIISRTAKTSTQKSCDSDSDSFYTPDSNISHFNFPSKFSNKTESSCENENTDSETFHTPLSSFPPTDFEGDSFNYFGNMSPSSPAGLPAKTATPANKDATSYKPQTTISSFDHLNKENSSFSGIVPPLKNSSSLPAENKSRASSKSSESNHSFFTNPTPPFSPISSTNSERRSQDTNDEAKSNNVAFRLPPSYEDVVPNRSSSPTKSGSFNSADLDTSLSRSATQSSVDSSMSFGSSYYTLYIVDPLMRPKTPEDTLWSPESSPPPEDLSRSSSTCSVDSLRTITPEPEYFEENDRAFRAMRGLSITSSNESLVTCCSQPRSLESMNTLEEPDEVQMDSNSNSYIEDYVRPSQPRPSHTFHSDPSTPNRDSKYFPKRTTSLDSIHSILRRYPDIKSPFGSISTFALNSSSLSPSPQPNNEDSYRPPSTDSPILFDSHHSSQESLLLFRPLPRYIVSSVSPEPEPAILCFLGPARPFEPPLTFKIVHETISDFDGFVHYVADMLSAEEQKHMEELRAYVVEDEGSWALGEDFNTLFARIFHDSSIPMEAQRHLIRIMAAAALKDDVILMLHQDRKEHTIMNYANKIESHPPEIQEALALFFCNMFEHLSPSEWLLYISEWQEGTQQISNIRVTTKIAVNALLHSNPKVQEYGTALMYNLGTKEVKTVVFDDVAPELAMAILQYFGNSPPEEYVWRVMTALCRFCYASSEVPALIKMIGPDPNTYKGMSERIDNVLEEVNSKLSRVRAF